LSQGEQVSGDIFLLGPFAAGVAAAAATRLASARQLAAVRQTAADRFLLGQRQVVHPNVQIVLLRESADQIAVIAVNLPEMVNNRLLTIQQNFDVENLERQLQLPDKAMSVVEDALPEFSRLISLSFINLSDSSQQLAQGSSGKKRRMFRAGQTHHHSQLQALMGAHNHPIPALESACRCRAEPSEFSAGPIANQVFPD
jgi:hypothetical protein